MCGIFGVLGSQDSKLTPSLLRSLVDQLFRLSESRGKESSGFACLYDGAISVYKQPVSASFLVRGKEYKRLFVDIFGNGGNSIGETNRFNQPLAFIGHTRLMTSGALGINQNNQPVIKSGLVGIHNGIITNDTNLWRQFPSLRQEYSVDTEVILALIRHFLKEKPLLEAIQNVFRLIQGSASIAVLFEDTGYMILATNTGSVYTCSSEEAKTLLFASEAFILKSLTKRREIKKLLGNHRITKLEPGYGLVVSLDDMKLAPFSLNDTETPESDAQYVSTTNFKIVDFTNYKEDKQSFVNTSTISSLLPQKADTPAIAIDDIVSSTDSLRLCTKCVLPETVPFIDFDEEGVCNFCRNYQKTKLKGETILEEFIAPYRSKSGEPDCIVTFSGGRDSSYGLHYIKTILKMNPIAYSYDWGMITDLARRNQARICGKLGVEHILVSADINRKRAYIRKNIEAWLKKPNLGMVPLFMAGDKQYFYYANKLRNQTEAKLIILCENPYEKTDFKSGFCGISPRFTEKSVYAIPMFSRIKLATYYAWQFLINPAYLNASVLDTIGAFFSYYLMPHGFLSLYQYIMWDEKEIVSTLIREYDWEVTQDTKSTWRIGDGTAPFYNYIYYTIGGFTENDTFRSNQIREGVISREQALALVREENKLRYDSFKWYCDIIGIDPDETIRRINTIPKRYPIKHG